MSEPKVGSHQLVYSIGHSNHTTEEFLALLRLYSMEVLVDIRSHPYSRYASQFNLEDLGRDIRAVGMKYIYLGRELGGRPQGSKFYDSEGHVIYALVAETPSFKEGIERLEKIIARNRSAIMCSEEDPARCHRYLLVGRVLKERGISIEHILGDGRIQTDEELAAQAGKNVQGLLFEELEEKTWRSIRSVLP